MTVFQSIVLGIVQGLTEFLPISSSAHLVLVPRVFGWSDLLHQNPMQIAFDVVLHLGSLLALLAYFWKDIVSLGKDRTPQNNKLLKLLIVGTIPAVMAGMLFNGFFEKLFASAKSTTFLLFITGIVILFAEYTARSKRDIDSLKVKDGIFIGMAQAIAIAPGISRSGSTISAGLILGLNREDAARFSFLLAIPAVLGAFIYSLIDASSIMFNSTFTLGFISSFVFSYLSIKFLLGYLRRGSLKIFAVYCIVAGLVGVALL